MILIMVAIINLVAMLFIFTSSPIYLVILIILSAISFCTLMTMMFYTSWFSYILFIIFLGGLMVLFVYICSIASNEVFEMKLEKYKAATVVFVTLAIYLNLDWEKYLDMNYFMVINKMFLSMNTSIINFSMLYLLMTLFVSVVISKGKFGPLRMKKN